SYIGGGDGNNSGFNTQVVLNAEMTGIQELKEKEIDEISAKGIKKIENHI
ncbi:8820_t:CDS:2, partial [Entrophospora sp. SA101]